MSGWMGLKWVGMWADRGWGPVCCFPTQHTEMLGGKRWIRKWTHTHIHAYVDTRTYEPPPGEGRGLCQRVMGAE